LLDAESKAASEAERVRLARIRFESLWRALQRIFFAESEPSSDYTLPRREWEYDALRDPEFEELWSTAESAILDSEIAEWETSLRQRDPLVALTPEDIAQGNEMASRITERMARLRTQSQYLTRLSGNGRQHCLYLQLRLFLSNICEPFNRLGEGPLSSVEEAST
jgi:hypothetical protein